MSAVKRKLRKRGGGRRAAARGQKAAALALPEGWQEPGMSRAGVVSRIAHDTFLHAPPLMPEGPWWEYLESNFSLRPEGFELDLWDWVRVNATSAADIALRSLAGVMVTATALPLGFAPRIENGGLRLNEMPSDWRLYLDLLEKGQGKKLFRAPPGGVEVSTYTPRRFGFSPADGRCVGLKFESAYEPLHPRHAEEMAQQKNNRIARARYWYHDVGPRPTIVAIHGFMADPYWINERFFALPWFYRKGYDVILFTLPHHGRRREPMSLFSGHGFFSRGLSGVNENMGQAISDVRVLIDHLLEERGVPEVGVTGVSLGGWTTALLACFEPRIAFAIPNVAVVSPVDLILEWRPAADLIRAGLLVSRRSIKELRALLAISTPLTYRPVLPRERLMVIGGVGDRLAPPKHSRLLWDHWGRCRVHWFPGNHVLHLDRGEYFARMLEFMDEIGFS